MDDVRYFVEDNFSFYPANYIEPPESAWAGIIWEAAMQDIGGDWMVACPMFSDPPARTQLTLRVLFQRIDGIWKVEIHDLKA